MSVGIGYHIDRAARRYPDKAAIIDKGVEHSYRAFGERTQRLARALLDLGARPGDRVAVFMDNRHEALEAFGAAMKAGFTHVPLNSRLTQSEAAELANDAGAIALITDEAHADIVAAGRVDAPGLRHVITVDGPRAGFLDFESLINAASGEPFEYSGLDARALIIYTSGTTGHAKGVVSTQRQILNHVVEAFLPEYAIGPDSRILSLYPHSSTASTNSAFVPAWVMGCTIVLDDVRHFTAERFLGNIERYAITHSMAVPTMLVRILRHVEQEGLAFDVATLELIAYGSAPMAPDVTAKLLAHFGPIFMQVYGMTESSGVVTSLRRDEHAPTTPEGVMRLRSCGLAVPGAEIDVVDEQGLSCPPFETGEVRFRSDYLMEEYWQDPIRTAETLRDGWLYSGDLGQVDAEGYLYIVDRKKDLIISGGQNIVSKEIEDILYEHPSVMEAAVIGVPDDEWGERVHTFVSLTGDPVDAAELHEYLSTRLASFKRPRVIDVLPELPKNSVGKIVKGELRAPFWETAGRSV